MTSFRNTTNITLATVNVLNNIVDYNLRFEKILGMLTCNENSSIVFIQELRYDKIDDTVKFLDKLGYEMLIRTQDKDWNNPIDTVAIAYNKAMFHEIMTTLPDDSESIITRLQYVNNNNIYTLCSYHGAWGCNQQAARWNETTTLDRMLSKYDDPVVYAGDFNATDNEEAIRFITGGVHAYNDEDYHTCWVEAQDFKASLHSDDNANMGTFMTSLNTGLAVRTAGEHNIKADLLPARRIDYMFTRGFTYGKTGAFTGDAHTIDISEYSDHNPVIASILV